MISKILITAMVFMVVGSASHAEQDLSKLKGISGVKVESPKAPEEKQNKYIIFSKEAFSNMSFQKVEPNVVSRFFGSRSTTQLSVADVKIQSCADNNDNLIKSLEQIVTRLKNYESAPASVKLSTDDVMDLSLKVKSSKDGEYCMTSFNANIPVSPAQITFDADVNFGKIDLGNSSIRFNQLSIWGWAEGQGQAPIATPTTIVSSRSLKFRSECNGIWYRYPVSVEYSSESNEKNPLLRVLVDYFNGCWASQ